MQKITTYLWFSDQAEDAAKLYTSLFEGSKILETSPGGPNGKPMMVVFELAGQRSRGASGWGR